MLGEGVGSVPDRACVPGEASHWGLRLSRAVLVSPKVSAQTV